VQGLIFFDDSRCFLFLPKQKGKDYYRLFKTILATNRKGRQGNERYDGDVPWLQNWQ
jgi:hypothetical protein